MFTMYDRLVALTFDVIVRVATYVTPPRWIIRCPVDDGLTRSLAASGCWSRGTPRAPCWWP